PDGQLLLIGNRAFGLGLWNPFTGQPAGPTLYSGDIRDARWLPDGRLVAAIFHGSKVAYLFDTTTGKRLGATAEAAHNKSLSRLAFSPDGDLLATGDESGVVGVWKMPSLEKIATFQAVAGQITGLDFSPDNRWLAILRTDSS